MMSQPRFVNQLILITVFLAGIMYGTAAQAAAPAVTWFTPYYNQQVALDLPVEDAVYNAFDLSGHVSGNYTAMLVKIKKGVDSTYYYFPVKNALCTGTVYLRYGTGDYQIEVNMIKPAKDRSVLAFDNLATFKMTNLSEQNGRYLFPSWGVESDDLLISNTAIAITKNAKTDLAKVQAIHDWVAKNIAYDMDKYRAGEFYEVQGALTTLVNKKGLCRDYADLTTALCRAIGIEAKTIIGLAGTTPVKGGHAWNEVNINGNWIAMDTTWDAGMVVKDKYIAKFSRQYFNLKSEVFMLSHEKTSEAW